MVLYFFCKKKAAPPEGVPLNGKNSDDKYLNFAEFDVERKRHAL